MTVAERPEVPESTHRLMALWSVAALVGLVCCPDGTYALANYIFYLVGQNLLNKNRGTV